MTKTQQIGHLKEKKTTNPSDFIPDNLWPYQPAFMVIVELDRKQIGKENRNMEFHVHVGKRPTLVKCQTMSDFLKANTCMT